MAYTVNPSTTEVLDLDTFLDHIRATVDFGSTDSLLGAASALRALSNNRTLIADWLNRNLSAELKVPDTGFVAGVTCLASDPKFLIRANVWMPIRANTLDEDSDNAANSYLVPHDHNFSFLTVGHAGPGYSTDIYEYDPARVVGYVGEDAHLTFLESTSLPQGKVMLYRESSDVHIQRPSLDFSVSLNILSRERRYRHSQRFFDLSSGRVTRSEIESDYRRLSFLCRMAGFVGDDDTFDLLEAYAWDAEHDYCSRWEAIDSCIRLRGEMTMALLDRAASDTEPHIAGRAAARLEHVPHEGAQVKNGLPC